jgi:hypothetical protein
MKQFKNFHQNWPWTKMKLSNIPTKLQVSPTSKDLQRHWVPIARCYTCTLPARCCTFPTSRYRCNCPFPRCCWNCIHDNHKKYVISASAYLVSTAEINQIQLSAQTVFPTAQFDHQQSFLWWHNPLQCTCCKLHSNENLRTLKWTIFIRTEKLSTLPT